MDASGTESEDEGFPMKSQDFKFWAQKNVTFLLFKSFSEIRSLGHQRLAGTALARPHAGHAGRLRNIELPVEAWPEDVIRLSNMAISLKRALQLVGCCPNFRIIFFIGLQGWAQLG